MKRDALEAGILLVLVAIVAAIGLTVALSGQTLDSEARVYEQDGRLEIEYVQGMHGYPCTSLYFGVRVNSEGWVWPQWWSFQDEAEEPEAKAHGGCLWTVEALDVDEVLQVHVRRVGHGYDPLLADLEPVFVPIPPPPPPVRRTPSGGAVGGGGNTGGGSPPRRGCKGTAPCGYAYASSSDIPDGCPGDYQLAHKPDAEGFGKYRRLWYFIGRGPELPCEGSENAGGCPTFTPRQSCKEAK